MGRRELLRFELFGRPIVIEYVGTGPDDELAFPAPAGAAVAAPPIAMVPCPHCARPNAPDRAACKGCGRPMTVSHEPLDLEARRAILTQEIARAIADGWAMVSQTETTAVLTRRGQANGCAVLLLLCLAILPGVLYYLLARPTQTTMIQVDAYGRVTQTIGAH